MASIWITYWISGISPPSGFFIGLAVALFIWAAILFLALVLIRTERVARGKLGRAIITRIAKCGDYVYWPLSLVAMLTSVLLSWSRLWDSGERGWGMDALFYMGVLMSFVVALVYRRASHAEANRN